MTEEELQSHTPPGGYMRGQRGSSFLLLISIRLVHIKPLMSRPFTAEEFDPPPEFSWTPEKSQSRELSVKG
eukprot:386513-Prorocentrum_minimum.AAC.1